MFICTSKKEATQGDPAAIYYSRVKRHQLGMIWLIDIQLAPGKFSERALLEHIVQYHVRDLFLLRATMVNR